jgi:hypothetical protein
MIENLWFKRFPEVDDKTILCSQDPAVAENLSLLAQQSGVDSFSRGWHSQII